jgi:hypothetical protein
MGGLPDRFLRPPSIELLRSAIPVGDDLVYIVNEDRVMRLVEEAGLLSQRRPGSLACTARGVVKAIVVRLINVLAISGRESVDGERA